MSTSSILTTMQLDRSLFREEPEGALTAWSVSGGPDFGLDCPSKEQRKKQFTAQLYQLLSPEYFIPVVLIVSKLKIVSAFNRLSMLKQVICTHLGLSLLGRPWLAWNPQSVGPESQRRPPSSGTPAAVCQPTGPEPPWLHCDAPSVDSHQLHRGKQQKQREKELENGEWLSSYSQLETE